MNVRNIRHPFTHVSLVDKYKKVTEVFNSCKTADQQVTTLKWALKVGMSDRVIFHIMGMYQFEVIKQCLEEEREASEKAPEPTPTVP